mmetsp:Transcript_85604/g.261864  ORF Transcript_85604/g.261864 Transcript_85604/m.261864 type:complete len:251 (+) Transcript_85604:498-1250(+)
MPLFKSFTSRMTKLAARWCARLRATARSAVSAFARVRRSCKEQLTRTLFSTLLAMECCASATAAPLRCWARADRCVAVPCSRTRCKTKLPKLLRLSDTPAASNSPTRQSSCSAGKCSNNRSNNRLRMPCLAASTARPLSSSAMKRRCCGGRWTTHFCSTKFACGQPAMSQTCPWNCRTRVSLSSSSAASTTFCNIQQPPSLEASLRAHCDNHCHWKFDGATLRLPLKHSCMSSALILPTLSNSTTLMHMP